MINKKEIILLLIFIFGFFIISVSKAAIRTDWSEDCPLNATPSGCSCASEFIGDPPQCGGTGKCTSSCSTQGRMNVWVSSNCNYNVLGSCIIGVGTENECRRVTDCRMNLNCGSVQSGSSCTYHCVAGWADRDNELAIKNGCEYEIAGENLPPVIDEYSVYPLLPVNVDSYVTFSIKWHDPNPDDTVTIYACKAAETTGCTSSWCSSSSGQTTPYQEICKYKAQAGDVGHPNHYWLYVCDNRGKCSNFVPDPIFGGTFTVKAACSSDGPNFNCPANCNVNEDPDCGCKSGDGWCNYKAPSYCTFYDDSDCARAGSPPSVTTSSVGAYDVTHVQANLKGVINNCVLGTCDQRGFEWGTNSSPPFLSGCKNDGTGCENGFFGSGAFSQRIQVSHDTQYYFRAKAHNSASQDGGWGYGEVKTFTASLVPSVSGTIFNRKIMITDKVDLNGDLDPDRLTVTVEVSWKDKNGEHKVTTQEYLYNWWY